MNKNKEHAKIKKKKNQANDIAKICIDIYMLPWIIFFSVEQIITTLELQDM